MPWSNQGGGPWGSGGGGKGPWGSGQQPSGPTPPDLEEFLRRSQDRLRTVLPGGLGGKGIILIVLAAVAIWGVSGFFRVDPDELGVVLRFGKYVREVQPGLNYHLPYPIETVLTPKALRVNKIDIGMRIVEDLRRGTTDPRRAGREPHAHRRREHRRRRFLRAVEDQAERRGRLSVQHPAARRHGEGGGRKRHARGGRALQHSADPDRRAPEHRNRRPGSDAIRSRQIRRRHSDHAGAAAEGRSAVAGDRRLPRRAGGPRRPRTGAERGADLRQQGRPGSARTRLADHPERRGLSRADGGRGQGRDLALPAGLRRVQEGAGRHPPAHVSRDHGAAVRRHRQDHHGFRRRSRSLSAARPALAAPATAGARRRREPPDETQSRWRHCRRRHHRGADHRLWRAVHGLPDPSGAGRAPGAARARGHAARTAHQDPADRQRHQHRQAHSRSREPGAGGDRLRPEAAWWSTPLRATASRSR